MKKLEIEETKTIWYSTFKTDIIKVALGFWISNFFIKKSSLANKCMSFSYSNSPLIKSSQNKYIQKINANLFIREIWNGLLDPAATQNQNLNID